VVSICATTGLALSESQSQRVYRLAKPSYGPLNPQKRPLTSHAERGSWNRFDLPGHQTIYTASTADGAYGELLGPLKVNQRGTYAASKYLDNAECEDLYTQISKEWVEADKLPVGRVDIHWLYEYRIYEIELPKNGWFVEIEHSRSLTYLTKHLPLSLYESGLVSVTLGEIHGSDRNVTTALAEAVGKTTLNGFGTAPLGVHYQSKRLIPIEGVVVV